MEVAMKQYQVVYEALKRMGIPYDIVEHPPALTTEEADSYIAVSYTHLDVYKRQILMGPFHIIDAVFKGSGYTVPPMVSALVANWVIKLPVAYIPVSYTHLDVYKRQAYRHP